MRLNKTGKANIYYNSKEQMRILNMHLFFFAHFLPYGN